VVLAPGGGSVSGQVFYLDSNNNRVAIVGATLETEAVVGFSTLPIFPFIQPVLEDRTATTDAGGNYTITGPVSGSVSNYTVEAGGFDTRIVAISAPTSAGSGDIVMTPLPRTIQGDATAVSWSSAGQVTTAVPTLTVTAALTSTTPGFTPPANDTFLANGTDTYSFGNLQPGSYTVTLSATGYHSTSIPVTVDPSPSAAPIQASDGVLEAHSAMTVRVLENSTSGAAVQSATVTLTAPGRTAVSTSTNASGDAAFTELFDETYTITVTKANFRTLTTTRALSPGQSRTRPVAHGGPARQRLARRCRAPAAHDRDHLRHVAPRRRRHAAGRRHRHGHPDRWRRGGEPHAGDRHADRLPRHRPRRR
jgi:hypothetical protein